MKKRIWGLFEALGFYISYCAAGSVARFLLLCAFSIYYAVLISVDHAVFNAEKFFSQVTGAVNGMPMLRVLVTNLVVIALFAVIIYARGGKFRKYIALENATLRSSFFSAVSGAGFWLISQTAISKFLSGTGAFNEYSKHIGELLGDNVILALIVSVIVAPVVEEIVFRGALYRAFERLSAGWVAVIVSSILFALAHVNPVHMAYALILGLLLGLLRMKTKSIVPCIALHFIYNAMNYLSFGFKAELWLVLIITLISYTLALHKKI